VNGEAPSYEVRFTAGAKRQILALDGSIRKHLRKVLEKKLALSPKQHGAPLVGVLRGFWSHHFASHRIIYRIYDDRNLVVVCAVGPRREGHKSDIYRQFEAIVKAGRTAQEILEALRSAAFEEEE
jgi:mRNA-degrading endonuclease RelE of RelBE toxin-antitoxin system